MPTYIFTCTKCKNEWEKQYSFAQFEEIVIPKLEACPDCEKSKSVQQIFTPPNINVGGTLGAQAEKNSKSLGSKIHEDKAEKVERENKKKGKRPWYGTMPKKNQRDIFGEKNEKTKKEKIKKYIERGGD